MDGVEPSLIRLLGLNNFFQGKSFPRSAEFGIRQQFSGRRDAAQRVEQAGVAEIYLRGFHQARAQIGLPRQQPANHVGLFQGIQISARGIWGDTE